jgi:hypothetical protein
MTYFKCGAAILLAACTAACASGQPYSEPGMSDGYITVDEYYGGIAPEMDPARKISQQDCTNPSGYDGGNLRCR